MVTFGAITTSLVVLQLANWICFLTQRYNSEGMKLVNSIMLGVVSLWCAAEITCVRSLLVLIIFMLPLLVC